MNSILKLGKPDLEGDESRSTCRFHVSMGNEKVQIYYKVKGCQISSEIDPMLPVSLTVAMAQGLRIEADGVIDFQFRKNLQTIQDIYSRWFLNLKTVKIDVQTGVVSTRNKSGRAACFFSGGVDSFYTLLKNQEEITHLIFVHGFDIKVAEKDRRDRIVPVLQKIAAGLKKEFIEIETNLREFADPYVSWEQYHGSALASVAQLLAPSFSKVFISSSNPYEVLIPNGSHVLLDPLWSSSALEVVHFGCEADRLNKITFIASNPAVQESLRVCWENKNGDFNCGCCEKCLRTMANLRALGILEKFKSFARRPHLSEYARIKVKNERTRTCVRKTIRLLSESGNDRPLEEALRDCVEDVYQGKFRYWPRRVRNFLTRKVFSKQGAHPS